MENTLWGEGKTTNQLPEVDQELLKPKNVDKLTLKYENAAFEESHHESFLNRTYNIPRDTLMESLHGVLIRSPSPLDLSKLSDSEEDTKIIHLKSDQCRLLIRRSLSIILLHVNFMTATENSLSVLTDVLTMYLEQFAKRIRLAIDQELLKGTTGFPNVLEKAFAEMKTGATQLREHMNECLSKKLSSEDTNLTNTDGESPQYMFKTIDHSESDADGALDIVGLDSSMK
ncbi:DgyrCDS3720 [Dimorphilus gyrociliatus]|uniref:DgyrCDS3720 n=1 Tax=Dimorphilus gyrociliatus TaxID=2664684 RepID=A0A7I8VEI3_9ANNE|nr:DgyrCDS3720 [Dimorphilus gyrociliatus]